jgi:tetratricopeptide (TPR) repeat protein
VPVLLDLARAAEKAGDHKGALGYLAHARSLEPNNAAVHFLFGLVYVQLDLGAEAYESLKKAVSLDPESAPVNYMMGVVGMHRHDPSEGVPYLEKYVSLQPNDPRGRFALGVGRFHANDFDGAQRDLAEVAERPETAAGANYFLARIARQSGRLDDARRHVERSLQAHPGYADAWAELGLLQTRAGEYAAAERSLQKALSLDAENYQAIVNLTALYTRTRDPRREEQAARLEALQKTRSERAQDFLRMVEFVPPSP